MIAPIRNAVLATVLVSIAVAEPIRLDPRNPHYFQFQGKTVALVTSGEHYGAVLNADFDYRRYLTALERDTLNYTRLFGGAYVEVPSKSFGILRNDLAPAPGRYVAPWARSQTPGYAGGGNKFDLERWDATFFERLHDLLSQAAKLGIVVELTLFSSYYDQAQWKISALNPSNNVNSTDPIEWKKVQTLTNGNILHHQEQYTRKLVREANQFENVFFEIQNEPWSDRPTLADLVNPYLQLPARDRYPNAVEVADEPSVEWQARVAEWISSEESRLPNKHLIAQNYCNFRFSIAKLLRGVSIVNFHYAYPEAVLLNYGLDKAIAYDETGFLGRDDASYTRQAWNFILSGGSTFNNLDYSFTAGHEDGTDTEPNGPGGGSPELRHRLQILSQYLMKLPLVSLRPDLHTVKHAGGVRVHVLSNPGHVYAMYLDGRGPADVTMDLPVGDYSGEWLNIVTGALVEVEKFEVSGGEKTISTPEFENGIALRLNRSPK